MNGSRRNRRHFLQTSLGASASVMMGGLAHADDDAPIPIIDTHVHLWDLQRFRLPWIGENSPLNRNYLPQDYANATRGFNVVKAIYVEVNVATAQQQAEADYISNLCQRGDTPFRAAIISGVPDAEDFPRYIRQFRRHRFVKGLRQTLHGGMTPRGHCVRESYIRGIRLLGELGLSFDLCMRHAELEDAIRLVDACRQTKFVLDHCGNPNVQAKDQTQWRRDIANLARRDHVVCKVSGITSSAAENWQVEQLAPFVTHVLDNFGPNRVMFGSDWPVCTRRANFARWTRALQQIVSNRPADQQRKLFHDNAARFFGV